MNRLLNQKLLFLISLLCVVTITVGAVFLPRYLSRGLDKGRLNKVTVSDRSHFSYLEQSSGGIIENIQALSFMKNEANLMLLSDMKADTARLNTDLLENVYKQAMTASEYGMLPWLGVGDYKTLRKSSYDVVTDWEDDIRFARYYSLTYDSDDDENTKELLNLCSSDFLTTIRLIIIFWSMRQIILSIMRRSIMTGLQQKQKPWKSSKQSPVEMR